MQSHSARFLGDFFLTFSLFYATIRRQKKKPSTQRFLFGEHCKISSTLKGARAAQRILPAEPYTNREKETCLSKAGRNPAKLVTPTGIEPISSP